MSIERQCANAVCVAQGLAFFTNALDSSAHGRLFTTLSLENARWLCACNRMTAHSRLQKSEKNARSENKHKARCEIYPYKTPPNTDPIEIPKQ